MSNMTKQEILEAIRQAAKDNGGKPLGVGRFEKETGIKQHEWGKYWPRFGDAQKEAGFVPNKLQGAHAEEFLITKIIELMRKLGKFPTGREINVERNCDHEFPAQMTFQRLGTKKHLATKVVECCQGKAGYDDIVEWCQAGLAPIKWTPTMVYNTTKGGVRWKPNASTSDIAGSLSWRR